MDYSRHQYDQLLKSLIGEIIVAVYYYEHTPLSYSAFHDRFHYLNTGLDIIFDSGRSIGITWGRKFADFNIDIKEELLFLDRVYPDISRTTMTQHKFWKSLIGKTIRDVTPYWEWFATTNETELIHSRQKIEIPQEKRQYYPQDIVFTFHDNTEFYISASTYNEVCDCLLAGMDNLVLIFDEKTAHQYLYTQ